MDDIQNACLIIDDHMHELVCSNKIQQVFTRLSHHNSITTIILTQNLFVQGKFARDIRLNVHYYFLLKSFTLRGQLRSLNQQLFPTDKKFLPDAYTKATKNKFSHLVVILHPNYEDMLRVCGNIFSSEHLQVFVPENE